MKKLIVVVLLLSLAGIHCKAQKIDTPESPVSVKVGAAYYPTVPSLVSFLGFVVKSIAVGEHNYVKMTFMPWTTLEAQYSFNEHIVAGIDIGFFTSSYTVRNKETNEIVERNNYMNFLGIMPEFRYNYLVHETFRLYCTAELGILCDLNNVEKDVKNVFVNFELTPFGLEVGKKVFFFAEGGVGLSYFGSRIGVGCRF